MPTDIEVEYDPPLELGCSPIPVVMPLNRARNEQNGVAQPSDWLIYILGTPG